GFSRYNFRSNVDIQATKGLQLQVDLAGRLERRIGPSSGFQEVFSLLNNMPPFALPIFNPDGTLGAASNVEIPFWRNPYGLVTQSGYYENSTNVMYGTISARHSLDFLLMVCRPKGFSVSKTTTSTEHCGTRNSFRIGTAGWIWMDCPCTSRRGSRPRWRHRGTTTSNGLITSTSGCSMNRSGIASSSRH